MADHPPLWGLTEAEAAARLLADGPNELPRPERRDIWRIAVEVLREPMFALLLAAGAIYLLLGEPSDAAVLLAFASLSIAIAIIQEVRSERVLDELRDLASPMAQVIREGGRRRIPARELVRGDLFALGEGDRVAADGVLREVRDLHADESLLTGESLPAEKMAGGTSEPIASAIVEASAVYAGTLIVRGAGVAEVVAVGGGTQMGRIGAALESIKPEATRLTLQTRRLVRGLGVFAFLVCGAVVLIIGLRGQGWLKALLAGVAIGMAMIPEEFPLVLTVLMVMGAWRISKAGVLTRKAAAIETLGSATVLCTDKTGTLTQNRMTIVGGWKDGRLPASDSGEPPGAAMANLIRIGVLASASDPFDPMERAFHNANVATTGQAELVRVYGLRPDLLAVTQVWRTPAGERTVAVKGSPEAVVDLCRLDPAARTEALAAAGQMARQGMRVLGLAQGGVEGDLPLTPRGLTLCFEGLVGLADPIRPDAAAAVRACQAAGVRVVMITGDHPETARAIGRSAGIPAELVMTGSELAEETDAELATMARKINVFARILPAQKLRIVSALKAAGEVVAMTGDGVNDAPALKAADIGVAMGERGSDVAREAAALVLLKDEFSAIVETIRLGRRIYDNLRRSMSFILSVHVPIAGLAILPLVAEGQILLGPVHIAFLEMFIDPMCGIAFEAEPEDPRVMRRPPRNPTEPLFSRQTLLLAALRGVVGLVAVMAAFQLSLWRHSAGSQARATAFTALVAVDIGLVLASRSSPGRGVSAIVRPNPVLWLLIAALIALLGLVLGTSAGEALFDFGPVDLVDIGSALGAGIGALAVGLILSPRRGDPHTAIS